MLSFAIDAVLKGRPHPTKILSAYYTTNRRVGIALIFTEQIPKLCKAMPTLQVSMPFNLHSYLFDTHQQASKLRL
jgi:hypothetical protein